MTEIKMPVMVRWLKIINNVELCAVYGFCGLVGLTESNLCVSSLKVFCASFDPMEMYITCNTHIKIYK